MAIIQDYVEPRCKIDYLTVRGYPETVMIPQGRGVTGVENRFILQRSGDL